MFANCTSLTTVNEIKLPVAQRPPYWSYIRSVNLEYMFDKCESLREVTIKYIKTTIPSNQLDWYSNFIQLKTFYRCSNFERLNVHIPDFTYEDKKTNFSDKFVADCPKFNYWYVPNIRYYIQGGSPTFLENVSENGVIVISSNDTISPGEYGIPATWTVEYALN